MLLSKIPKRPRVIRPFLPNIMIMESERTNGGETTGSMETTRKSPVINFVRSFTYTSTYAKRRPISADKIPTAKPTLRVLVIARSNEGKAKMRVNTSKLIPLSETTESTIRMASGYKINRVKKAIRTTMVVIKIGSPRSFFRSSRALWDFAILVLTLKH